jgi:hypothetical protein
MRTLSLLEDPTLTRSYKPPRSSIFKYLHFMRIGLQHVDLVGVCVKINPNFESNQRKTAL